MAKNTISKQEQVKYDMLWDKEWKDLHKIGPSARSRNRILLRLFKKYIKNGSVLDSGCGDCTFLDELHNCYRNTLRYDASDVSNKALKLASKFEFLDGTYQSDVTQFETLPKKKYTAVISSEVLEHIKDWKLALTNLVRVMDDKAYIFITAPHGMKYWGINDEFANHWRRFEKGQIERVLERLGLTIKESISWGWPIYWFYYTFILNHTSPESNMHNITSPLKVLISNILFHLFYIDDFFDTTKGRRLFITAQKK